MHHELEVMFTTSAVKYDKNTQTLNSSSFNITYKSSHLRPMKSVWIP